MRRHIRAEEETGELNIVPYLDVVVNLVMFMLLSMTGLITLGVINVSAPPSATETTAAAENAPKLLLTVSISRKGFFVSGAEGVLGADAAPDQKERPPTVPLKANDKGELVVYDYAGLNAVLVKVKEKYPAETQVILNADWELPYDTLVQTMDACREQTVTGPDGKKEKKQLFFDVSLSQPTG